jgi:type IV pilus assembly protein PilC
MQTFSYKAIMQDGKEKKGTVAAEDQQDAARKIKDNGLIPLEISTQNLLEKDLKFPGMKKKVSTRDLSVFCRQFSSILKAGVSVINALEMLSEQTENKTLQEGIKNVQSSVEKGENLANSMRRQDKVFPSLLVNMVQAGEASGSLEGSIDRMSVQFEKDAKLKGLVKKAMIYPIVLCFVAVAVIALMLLVVIPRFMSMFEELGTQLPMATRMMIGLSKLIKNYWYIIIAVIIGLVFAKKSYAKTARGRKSLDTMKLKMPILGKLVAKTACARFSRTMSTLLQAGMPMMQAIEITANTMDNVLFKEALLNAKNGVGLGLPLSQQLTKSHIFPPLIIHMTSIGEDTGNLEEMLVNVANYYEEEVEITTQQVTALMEPLIILFMAVVVGGIIMSIYGPMIQLYNSLS